MQKEYKILLVSNHDVKVSLDELKLYKGQKYVTIYIDEIDEEYFILYFNLDNNKIINPVLLTDITNSEEFRYMSFASIILSHDKCPLNIFKEMGYKNFPFKVSWSNGDTYLNKEMKETYQLACEYINNNK